MPLFDKAKQFWVNAFPILVASGVAIGNPIVSAGGSKPAAVAAGVALSLLSAGAALREKHGGLLPGKRRHEQLANHDILRIVRASWGEAAAASVRRYIDAQKSNPHSLLTAHALPEFLKVLDGLKASLFEQAEQITLVTVRSSLEAARQELLSTSDSSLSKDELRNSLTSGLVASVIDALKAVPQARDMDLPPDFESFLSGDDPRFPGGIVDQLCIYVAFYLKSDQRAQAAVVQFTLQEVLDREEAIATASSRIETLCTNLKLSQDETGRALLDGFESRMTSLVQQFDDLIRERFNLAECPQLDAPFHDASGNGGQAGFTYRDRKTPLIGRNVAIESLINFLGDPSPGLWTVISGPAGTGKSRLAAELIAKVCHGAIVRELSTPPGQWRAGFLRNGEEWLKAHAVNWKADGDALIVIDYAGELDRTHLSDFLAHLDVTLQVVPECKVRVVLIDRLPPDSDLGLVKRMLTGNDQSTQIARNRWSSTKISRSDANSLSADGAQVVRAELLDLSSQKDSLALTSVTAAEALHIARDWSGTKWTSEAQKRVEQAFKADGELARPLFAALIGNAIQSDNLPTGELSPVNVASTALARLLHRHNKETDPTTESAKMLLATATACQGISEEDLFDDDEVLAAITGETQLSDAQITGLKIRLRELACATFGPNIPQLEPDFLGGLFVLERLLHLNKTRALARADRVMALAWKCGRTPAAFLIRLVADFAARADQVALATLSTSNGTRVNELILRLALSALEPEALSRNGDANIADTVYLASKAGNIDLANELISRLEASYSKTPQDIDPVHLARAWFGFAISNDLPPSASAFRGRALDRINQIREEHNTSNIALVHALSLASAWSVEPDLFRREALASSIHQLRTEHSTPGISLLYEMFLLDATSDRDPVRSEALADRISQLRQQQNIAEIALLQANILYNATVGEPDRVKCQALADQIGLLREEHNTPDIALVQAQALYNVTVGEPDPARCQTLADCIDLLREEHDTPDIALQQAQALLNATVGEVDAVRREALAASIGRLREKHNTTDIALLQARALYNATVNENEPGRREILAHCIGQLLQEHDTTDIAFWQAQALYNATVSEAEPRRREVLARCIDKLRRQYNTPDIAREQAKALYNAMIGEIDAHRCGALADLIGQLRLEHNTAEIAAIEATALYNVAAGKSDVSRYGAIADRIGQLRREHNTPEIALRQAQALYNATIDEPDPVRREALADRIGLLRQEHNIPEIALRQAKALYNATVDEPNSVRCEALADRIGLLRQEHNIPDIALPQAQALYNATGADPNPVRREALADRIGLLRQEHNTPDIALQQAQALYNATVDEPNSVRCEALADRIDLLRHEHNTPAIAMQRAKALSSATNVEPDSIRCEALADRIGLLRHEHDSPDMALEQAQALYNGTVVEPNPARREALADQIGVLRQKHNTPDITMLQAKALLNATGVEPDSVKRAALADRIGLLRQDHDTSVIALRQARALYNAIFVEPDAVRREALADRIGLLRREYNTTDIAAVEVRARLTINKSTQS